MKVNKMFSVMFFFFCCLSVDAEKDSVRPAQPDPAVWQHSSWKPYPYQWQRLARTRKYQFISLPVCLTTLYRTQPFLCLITAWVWSWTSVLCQYLSAYWCFYPLWSREIWHRVCFCSMWLSCCRPRSCRWSAPAPDQKSRPFFPPCSHAYRNCKCNYGGVSDNKHKCESTVMTSGQISDLLVSMNRIVDQRL